jgi:hypothetical protein
MTYEDPDFSSIDSLPDPNAQPKPSAELDALAAAIRTTGAGISADAGGKTPDEVVADVNSAANTAADMAAMAATMESAIKILKDAVAAWRKDAPKKAELDKAEKWVTDAGTALASAQKSYDEAKDATERALVKPVLDMAVAEQQAAILNLQTLKNNRKAADEAYERERKKATAKLAALSKTVHDGDSPITQGSGTGTQTPGGTRSGGSGTPAAKPGSGTPAAGKPAGTPTATSPSSNPTSTNGKSSDTDLNTALAAAALAGQNQNQQGQGQQAAATTPQASTPQQPQTGQQSDKKDDPSKKSTDAIDVDDLIREGALPASAAATLTGVGGANPTTAAPVSNGTATTTTFRPAGTTVPGTLPGGTPAPATAPVTSGNSVEGLNTKSDVTGRSTPAPTAFSATPNGAATHTSGATGAGNTAQQAAQQQQAGQRGAGMPMMPMVPPMGGAPSGGGGRGGEGEAKPGVVRYQPGEVGRHGEDETSQAVRGGTIAQNRPDTAA